MESSKKGGGRISYDSLCSGFRWDIPSTYNLGEVLCRGARAGSEGVAVIEVQPAGEVRSWTFQDLDRASNRLANLLRADGHQRGAQIAVMLPQSVAAAISYLAIWKAGLIAVPLLTGTDGLALLDRLKATAASAIISSAVAIETGEWREQELPALRKAYAVLRTDAASGTYEIDRLVAEHGADFDADSTLASDPAFVAFTSGSEGVPKGVVHGHALVEGILPSLHFTQMPRPGDRVWSHFEWGWLGGLLVALGAWRCGATVVIQTLETQVTPATLGFLSNAEVNRVSISPTALRMLQFGTRDHEFPRLTSITTGGERLDRSSRRWVYEKFGVELCEIYGLSECSAVLGSGGILPVREGAIGKPAPGQRVRILDEDGRALEPGMTGMIAVEAPHPALFLGYLGDEHATRQRYRGSMLLTGDRGSIDKDGYFWFEGRADDVIKVAGRRIGPVEIENAVLALPGVSACAAVGVPDPLAGEKIVVWVQPDAKCDRALLEETGLITELRKVLPAYQVPRTVRVVEVLPLTSTGKVSRREVRESEISRET